MIILLLIGLTLAGASLALALRTLSAAARERRQAVQIIASYGFGARIPHRAAEPVRGGVLSRLVSRPGALVARRIGSERQRELRNLLRGAGLYRTPLSVFLGLRLLATVLPPVGVLALAQGLDLRALVVALSLGAL